MMRTDVEFGPSECANAATLIKLALAEDLNSIGDLTSQVTIPSGIRGTARFEGRATGVMAGLPIVTMLAESFGLLEGWKPLISDGTRVQRGAVLGRIEGRMRDLLALERTALNFLQRLSGVATMTEGFVRAVEGTRARIFDTRKTTPGWRALEKYAVRCGGGQNHRIGLFDQVLIKDNHLAVLATTGDPIGRSIEAARNADLVPQNTPIEVEVDTLDQFERALACRPDIILLDNFTPDVLQEAVRRRDAVAAEIALEASGGITLESVVAIARTGVDQISIGALTHSAPALDIGLDFEPLGSG